MFKVCLSASTETSVPWRDEPGFILWQSDGGVWDLGLVDARRKLPTGTQCWVKCGGGRRLSCGFSFFFPSNQCLDPELHWRVMFMLMLQQIDILDHFMFLASWQQTLGKALSCSSMTLHKITSGKVYYCKRFCIHVCANTARQRIKHILHSNFLLRQWHLPLYNIEQQ